MRLVVCTARVGEADEATRRLVTVLAALSPAVQLELLDRDDDRPLLERSGVERTSAIVLMTGGVEIGDTGIRFYGLPTPALTLVLADDGAAVARGETSLSPAARR